MRFLNQLTKNKYRLVLAGVDFSGIQNAIKDTKSYTKIPAAITLQHRKWALKLRAFTEWWGGGLYEGNDDRSRQGNGVGSRQGNGVGSIYSEGELNGGCTYRWQQLRVINTEAKTQQFAAARQQTLSVIAEHTSL